jgi:hypothetical protein
MKKIGKGFSPYVKIDNNGEYFCGKCGKAGFTERKKINGHIGGCNGTKDLMEEMGTTTTTTSATRSGGFDSSLSEMISYGGLGSSIVGSSFGLLGSSPLNLELARIREDMEMMKKFTTNHISHLSGLSGGLSDIFSDNRFKIAMVVVGVLILFYVLENGDQKTKVSMGGKLLDLAIKKL